MGTSQTPDVGGGSPRPGQESGALPRRILLVDDQPFFLTMGQAMLRGGGYEVHTAPGGAEALKAARVTRPDAILLDVEMPGMDGFETCQRLKADPVTAAIPVAKLTATQDRQLNQKAFKAGAGATILKSVNSARLLNMLRVVLTTARDRRTAPRVAAALAIEYEDAERAAAGETLNVSPDGMFIKTPRPADMGALLLPRFSLPGSPRWECSARVVWVRPPEGDHPYPEGMGVQFVDLPPDARAALAAFVAAKAPVPVQP